MQHKHVLLQYGALRSHTAQLAHPAGHHNAGSSSASTTMLPCSRLSHLQSHHLPHRHPHPLCHTHRFLLPGPPRRPTGSPTWKTFRSCRAALCCEGAHLVCWLLPQEVSRHTHFCFWMLGHSCRTGDTLALGGNVQWTMSRYSRHRLCSAAGDLMLTYLTCSDRHCET